MLADIANNNNKKEVTMHGLYHHFLNFCNRLDAGELRENAATFGAIAIFFISLFFSDIRCFFRKLVLKIR